MAATMLGEDVPECDGEDGVATRLRVVLRGRSKHTGVLSHGLDSGFRDVGMVQPRGRPRRKRRASHTETVAPRASPAGALEEEGLGDGNEATQKRVRSWTAQPSQLPLPLQEFGTTKPPPLLLPPLQDMYVNIINEPLPLGLRLKKSPSFVDLICMCLSKENSTKENSTKEISTKENSTKEISTKGRSAMKDIVSKPPLKKDVVKASNFPANFLKIGNWEYTSQYEGDLVAKCYYAKHKLVWEVLNDGLKSKIEVQWLDITAIKATCPEEGDGTLELMEACFALLFDVPKGWGEASSAIELSKPFSGATASDVQAKIVAQEQRNLNLCNHASPEVPKEFQEIAESLLSDTHAPPSADEKYLLARVDSLSNLIEKGAAPSTVSVPERNYTIAAGEVGHDAFAEELGFCFEDEEQWAPAGRTVDGGAGPPAISRKESVAGLFENIHRRIPSMSELFDIAED
uniref:TRF2/HOY1 PH-like domain-containing protein n=1 Tax=Aegilops tauschii TaxID=37682 RepID=R7W9Q9_AEGTA